MAYKWVISFLLLVGSVSALPAKHPSGSWTELRTKNLNMGFSRERVDHILEICRANGLSVNEAENLLGPVYAADREALPTECIFLKVEEGLAKQVPWQEVLGEADQRLACLRQADALMRDVEVRPCEKREHLLLHTCMALESGLPPEVLASFFRHEGSACSGRLVYLIEVAESLQLMGLPSGQTRQLVLDCLDRDLGCAEVKRVVTIFQSRLQEGKSFELVRNELWGERMP